VSAEQLRVQFWSVNLWAMEAEETELLRFITKKHLVKTPLMNSHCGERLASKDK
jgi:hypothetical protein